MHEDHLIIYSATNENTDGALQSFTVTPDGVISSAVDTIETDGDAPAFAAALSTGPVAVMNYNTGNGRIIPTTSSPLEFDDSAAVITFPPPSDGVSHPHMAYEYGSEILVPDLVSDLTCSVYRVLISPGSG